MTPAKGQSPIAQSHLLELTSVRAFAAFVVVLFHMYQPDPEVEPGFWRRLILDGHLGVDFFFVLSGFILTHVYIRRWREGTFEYKSFLWARFARVYPLHFVMLLLFLSVYTLATLVGFGDFEGLRLDHLPWHLLLMHSWGFTDSHSWNFPSWSVSAEAFAYLTFPAFLFLVPTKRPWMATMIASGLLLGAWFLLKEWGWTLTKLMYNFGIIRICFEFLLGVSVYLIFERSHLRPRLASAITAASLVVVLAMAAIEGPEIVSVFMFAIIILCLGIRSRSEDPSFLRSRVLVYLGEISYSTYMIHLLVLMVGRKLFDMATPGLELGGPLGVILIFGVIYGGSVLLYHGVELPARSFLRSRSGKKTTAASSPI